MEPFEKHRANPGALEECAADLVVEAAAAIYNGEVTQQAYRPAIENWDGMCAPEIQAAPRPLEAGTGEASLALGWAAVATTYWAGQVRSFNERVDQLQTEIANAPANFGVQGTYVRAPDNSGMEYQEPTQAQIDAARAEFMAAKRREWWEAYNTYILDGGDRSAAMLRDGPTAAHIEEARRVGALPGEQFNMNWNPLSGGPWGYLGGPLGDWGALPYGTLLGTWIASLGFGLGADFYNWRANRLNAPINRVLGRLEQRLAASGWRTMMANRPGLWGRLMSPWHSMIGGWHSAQVPFLASRAGWLLDRQSSFRTSAARATAWASKRIPVIGGVIDGVASGWQQWQADSGRPDLDDWERGGRAGVQAVSVGVGAAAGGVAGAWAGAATGAAVGAAVGSVIPGAGTAVGFVVGAGVGVAGAWVGSQVGGWLNSSGVGEAIGGGVRDAVGAIGDAAGAVGNTLGKLNPFG